MHESKEQLCTSFTVQLGQEDVIFEFDFHACAVLLFVRS